MKKIKAFAVVIILIWFSIYIYFYLIKLYAKKEATEVFLNNIKIENRIQAVELPGNIEKVENYNFEMLKKKGVIDLASNKTLQLSTLLRKKNIFINFWFKGCKGCELEMPEIQTFYEKYNQKIQFVILSNDDKETVQKYISKYSFKMPFYVFKEDTYPVEINIFPTSHLITNNTTKFIYAGVGYFDNEGFNKYIDSVLIK